MTAAATPRRRKRPPDQAGHEAVDDGGAEQREHRDHVPLLPQVAEVEVQRAGEEQERQHAVEDRLVEVDPVTSVAARRPNGCRPAQRQHHHRARQRHQHDADGRRQAQELVVHEAEQRGEREQDAGEFEEAHPARGLGAGAGPGGGKRREVHVRRGRGLRGARRQARWSAGASRPAPGTGPRHSTWWRRSTSPATAGRVARVRLRRPRSRPPHPSSSGRRRPPGCHCRGRAGGAAGGGRGLGGPGLGARTARGGGLPPPLRSIFSGRLLLRISGSPQPVNPTTAASASRAGATAVRGAGKPTALAPRPRPVVRFMSWSCG